ncbi:putative GNAT family N-acyltransferase [Gracilibacillus halotolerans]|uniref:Putative GNAT family N-acyltransferase n=1 Tax=Gracilibacillus halotolerans TaxID=74386 RepID=A0A841RKU4_9BACI|nr:GNAT family N-acetyltransferase [Gracilibacillus halotolerans]MBB6512572.1 putative GNAT family N-acyltransferase [Gracilibacillus halotolerans]
MNILIATTDQHRKDAYYVREEVFVKEQGVPMTLEIDDLEEEAIHFIGYQGNQPIAASRMRFVDDYAKMERICVRKNSRGKGLGKEILLAMENKALKENIKKAKLHAQVQAKDFYKSLGYSVLSDKEFMDAGIPHVAMVKNL